ncbi:MAG TPA: S41 family peptidase [Planctomycetaceae bacterium]|nr:S41 family peptidase [Planctomycetaceae bacterium]
MSLQRCVGLLVLTCVLLAPVRVRAAQDEDYYELMKVFVDSFEQIERNYVKEVDRRELIEAALRGMVEQLDPYSNYIGPEDLPKFNQQVEGEFGGIGIQVAIDSKTRRLTVMTPLPGTPAYRAGVKAGDQIMEIEGKSTEGFTIEDAVRVLKGKPGEPVTIGVLHAGSTKVDQLTVTRELIHVASVQGDSYKPDGTWNFMIDPEKKIGYIRLSAFGRDTAEELRDALTSLKAAGMRGLILDLRFNPGGLLGSATEICDLFIEQGRIVSTKGRNTEEKVWNAKKVGTFSDFPMAILINHYSASASEIVSACLQDHKRAVIVGERSWGKGSVQNVIELESGKSALKLTTASYHRPSGKNIHRFPGAKDSDEWGVMPDEGYKVEFSTEDMLNYQDFRRGRDVLSKEGPPKSDYVDRQYQKALDYVLTQLGDKAEEKPASDKKDEKEGKKDAEAAKPAEEKKAGKEGARAPATVPTDRIEAMLRLYLLRKGQAVL